MRSFRLVGVDRDAHTCRILPAVVVAAAMRAFMSAYWSPSARNKEPRYLKVQTFSMSSPLHFMRGLSACRAFCCLVRVSLSAVEPCHLRLECVRVIWDFSAAAVL